MLRYVYIALGTFAVVALLCVTGTLRDTGGTMPDAGTLAADIGIAYGAAALLAVAIAFADCRACARPSR